MMFGRWGGGWPGTFYGGGGWMMGIGMVFNILIIGLVIFMIFRLLRGGINGCCSDHGHHGTHADTGNAGRETPVEIVTRRYAQGEIDREQYRQMLEDLTKQ